MKLIATAQRLGLFDTLVPLSSIVTAAAVVGFTLPRREHFGLFLLLWWAAAVFLSLNHGVFFFGSPSESLSSSWSRGDAGGVALMLGLPPCVLLALYVWFRRSPSLRRFLLREVPLWGLLGLHMYRLDGLSVVAPLGRGDVPPFVGYQTVLLDVVVGAVAVPMTVLCYRHRRNLGRLLVRRNPPARQILWFWNSLGLYDLCSAHVVLVMNYCHWGSPFITDPPLTFLGVHPFPLLILFQVPLAIASHALLLSRLDELIERQSDALPLHLRRLRGRG
jgi:hypothetical protein